MSAPQLVPTCSDCSFQWIEDGRGQPACCPECDGDTWSPQPEARS